MVGFLLLGIVYIIAATPNGDLAAADGALGENISAQARLDDLYNWLQWLLAAALAITARLRFDKSKKQDDSKDDDF